MFDIGFWELTIIGVVALLVIGPERLPGVARTVGQWIGKAKKFVSYVQSDIKQELGKVDELKQLLEEQAQIKEVHEIIEQTVSETKKIVSVGADLKSHAVKAFEDLEDTENSHTNMEPTPLDSPPLDSPASSLPPLAAKSDARNTQSDNTDNGAVAVASAAKGSVNSNPEISKSDKNA